MGAERYSTSTNTFGYLYFILRCAGAVCCVLRFGKSHVGDVEEWCCGGAACCVLRAACSGFEGGQSGVAHLLKLQKLDRFCDNLAVSKFFKKYEASQIL